MSSAAEQLVANLRLDTFLKARDLHKRLLFMAVALIVYRLGTFIPIPGIDPEAVADAFSGQSSGLLGVFNVFSGGAVERMAIFALNVMPYISASIIVQLMGAMYPPWEKLRKEGGEAGRQTLNQYSRYLTLVLALFQAFAVAKGLQATDGLVLDPGPLFIVSTVAILTCGAMFLMWIGEQMTARGVGNGLSLLIFAGIVAGLPRGISQTVEMAKTGAMSSGSVLLIVGIAIAVIVVIVFVERAQRRVFTHYPRGAKSALVWGADASFLPLKVNTSGVMAPIFASSLLLLPTTAAGFLANTTLPTWLSWLPALGLNLQNGQPAFMVFYGALIVFFCFFYTGVMFNPREVAENLRKYGGFIPGTRPGSQTAEYLRFVISRITVIGAVYVTLVCLLPEVLITYYHIPFYLGGTSILIVVSVTLDTVAAIQAHMVAYQYEGLIKQAKLHPKQNSRGAATSTAPIGARL